MHLKGLVMHFPRVGLLIMLRLTVLETVELEVEESC